MISPGVATAWCCYGMQAMLEPHRECEGGCSGSAAESPITGLELLHTQLHNFLLDGSHDLVQHDLGGLRVRVATL